jgi:DNA helicase-2/ATP-dependent DNA helicase PcrA
VELADNFDVDAVAATGEPATMRDFVEHLADRASAQHAPSVDGVTLTTIHAAKGLEWDAVFLVGMSEGLLPISMAETDEAVEEERRLLYVGITRAREHLNASFARSRKEGGRSTRKRTRFLEKWWPDAHATPQRRPQRTAAHELNGDEAKLFEALKAWRLELAQVTSKPAFTVLVDTSLVAIARHRPQTMGELAQVHGVGASKLDRYGADILGIVAAH